MPVLIDIQIAPQYEPLIEEGPLRRAVAATVTHQGWQDMGQVVIVVTDDESIRSLNLEFRDLDQPTDVLAFPGTLSNDFVTPPDYSGYLGDVVISYSRAEVQAFEARHSVSHELQLLAIHGVLHLMGLDDSDEAGYRRMTGIQDEIVSMLATTPSTAAGTDPEGTAFGQ